MNVTEVEGDSLADAQTSVERDKCQHAVVRAETTLDIVWPLVVPMLGDSVRLIEPANLWASDALTGGEVADGGQRGVDGGGSAVGDGLEMCAVIPARTVHSSRVRQGVAIGVGVRKPDQVLANARRVDAAGVGVDQGSAPAPRRTQHERIPSDRAEGPASGRVAAVWEGVLSPRCNRGVVTSYTRV